MSNRAKAEHRFPPKFFKSIFVPNYLHRSSLQNKQPQNALLKYSANRCQNPEASSRHAFDIRSIIVQYLVLDENLSRTGKSRR
jgi:hypothetical protein